MMYNNHVYEVGRRQIPRAHFADWETIKRNGFDSFQRSKRFSSSRSMRDFTFVHGTRSERAIFIKLNVFFFESFEKKSFFIASDSAYEEGIRIYVNNAWKSWLNTILVRSLPLIIVIFF